MTPFHISILATVKGVTQAIIDDMVRAGMNDPSDIVDSELTAKDIADTLEITPVTAGLIRKAAHAARGADASDGGEMAATLTLLGGLDSPSPATRRAAVLGLRAKRIHKVVPGPRGGVDLAESAGLLLSNQRAQAEREGLWNGRGLIDVVSFMPPEPETLRSPFGAELVEQGDPLVATDSMTGIPWGMLRLDGAPAGRATLGLCMWAVSKNIHAGASETVVYNDFLTGGPICQRAVNLANNLKVTKEMLVEMPVIKRTVAPPAAAAAPILSTPRRGLSRDEQIAKLLLSLFSADELRREVRYTSDELEHSLPGAGESPAKLAPAVVELLDRHGLLTTFLHRVRDERPRRAAEVDALLAML